MKEYYLYDLHGQPTFYNASNTKMNDTAIGVRHLFTGQQWYTEIGLYDLRNRYYSPDIGRFMQSDPISFGGDASNLYRYCGNNPLKWSDPSGLISWSGIFRWLGNLIGPTDTVPRVTVTASPLDIGQGLTSNGQGDWQPANPIDPSFSSGLFSHGSFGGPPISLFNPFQLTLQSGLPQPGSAAFVPAVNPTTPYVSWLPRGVAVEFSGSVNAGVGAAGAGAAVATGTGLVYGQNGFQQIGFSSGGAAARWGNNVSSDPSGFTSQDVRLLRRTPRAVWPCFSQTLRMLTIWLPLFQPTA